MVDKTRSERAKQTWLKHRKNILAGMLRSEVRKRNRKLAFARGRNPEIQKKKKIALKQYFKLHPEASIRSSQAAKQLWQKRRNHLLNLMRSPARKKKRSETSRKMWREHRVRLLKVLNTPEIKRQQILRGKERFRKNPDFYFRMGQKGGKIGGKMNAKLHPMHYKHMRKKLTHKILSDAGKKGILRAWQTIREKCASDKIYAQKRLSRIRKNLSDFHKRNPDHMKHMREKFNILPEREKFLLRSKAGKIGLRIAKSRHPKIFENVMKAQMKQKMSKWEFLVAKQLRERGVKSYRQNYRLSSRFWFDGAFVKQRILIEIDGDYWHANPELFRQDQLYEVQKSNAERDKLKNKWAQQHDWTLLRIWVSELKKDLPSCIDKIVALYKQKS